MLPEQCPVGFARRLVKHSALLLEHLDAVEDFVGAITTYSDLRPFYPKGDDTFRAVLLSAYQLGTPSDEVAPWHAGAWQQTNVGLHHWPFARQLILDERGVMRGDPAPYHQTLHTLGSQRGILASSIKQWTRYVENPTAYAPRPTAPVGMEVA